MFGYPLNAEAPNREDIPEKSAAVTLYQLQGFVLL